MSTLTFAHRKATVSHDGMQHEYEVSPYGGYLIDRLAAPD